MKLIKIADSVYINPSHVVRAYTGEAWSENQRKTVPYTHVVMSDGNTELTALSLEALAEILGEVDRTEPMLGERYWIERKEEDES